MIESAVAFVAPWPAALVASTLAAIMASIGILFVSLRREMAERYRPFFAALASGVLLATAIFILPEAFSGSELAPMGVLAGYFSLFLLSRVSKNRRSGSAVTAFLAIAAHSTIDGIEYGLLFEADTMAGVLGAGGLILHEFSEGVILYLILRTVGVRAWLALLLALLGAAVTTPLGTLASLALIPNLSPTLFSMALGYAAGALLFVGASQLPSEFGELDFRASVSAYGFGALIGVALMLSTHSHHAHDHDHHDGGTEHQDVDHHDH